MFTRRLIVGAALAGSMLATTAAFAQSPSQPIVGISVVTTYSGDARITAVDPTARTVTLAYTNGATAVRKVGPTVANFATTKVGDMVAINFEDRLTFVLAGPNAKVPRGRDIDVTVSGSGGGNVAGVTAGQTVANWWVTAVNPSANTLSVVNPNGGEIRNFTVTSQTSREELSRVKPGDYLTAVNTDVAVVSITKK
jgi:hypothetical protein